MSRQKHFELLLLSLLFVFSSVAYAAPGFVGQDSGVNGQVFLRARYYDPETGTFLSKDPLGVNGSINGYQYCSSDSINHSDPSGNSPRALLNPPVQLAILLVGISAGVINQGFHDFVSRQLSGFQKYDNSAIAGVVTTEIAVGGEVKSTTLLGAVYGGTKNAMDQLTDDTANSFNYTELGLNTAGGAGSGKLANMLGAKVELPDSITGSGSITAVGEWALSYLGNKPDMNISLSTAGKLTLTLVANQAADNIIGGSIDGLNDVGTSLLGLSPGTSTGSSSTPSDGTIPVGGIINQNTPTMFQLPVGGVLLNTAATLVGQNLSDITGAMYDPVSGQFVMLGTNNPAPIEGINLDYLYTALQAVYGSAQPPFVTLNPSASAYTQWSGQFAPGQSGGFTILYNPIWPNEDTTVDVLIFASQNGTPVQWRARYNCVPDPLAVYYYPWEIFPPMEMVFSNWVTDTYATPPPSGITFPTYEHVTYAGLATYQPFT
jgi:RHS repeat-associated protein